MTDQPANLFQLLSAQRPRRRSRRGAAVLAAPFQPWLRLLARLQIDREFQGKFDPSDIAQQTMLEAYRDLPKFRGQSEPELLAWLRQILAHVLGHEIRRHRGTQQRDLSREVSLEQSLAQSSLRLGAILAEDGPSPSQQAVAREQEVRLAEVLAEAAGRISRSDRATKSGRTAARGNRPADGKKRRGGANVVASCAGPAPFRDRRHAEPDIVSGFKHRNRLSSASAAVASVTPLPR